MPNEPSSDATLVTPEQVHQELARLLRDRNHMGVRNLIGDRLLDPRNPFQRTRRQPKKWVVTIGGLAVLALMIVYFFRVR